MKVEILTVDDGINEALFGLGLSFGKTSGVSFSDFEDSKYDDLADTLYNRSVKLAGLGGGHDKFLRCLPMVLDITAPLYWWKQFDTYKIGTVAQSESTMHTLMKTPITQEMFEYPIYPDTLEWLEKDRQAGHFEKVNNNLPQGFLQRRIIYTNYAAVSNIIKQRKEHKLREWRIFCRAVLSGVEFPQYLIKEQEATE